MTLPEWSPLDQIFVSETETDISDSHQVNKLVRECPNMSKQFSTRILIQNVITSKLIYPAYLMFIANIDLYFKVAMICSMSVKDPIDAWHAILIFSVQIRHRTNPSLFLWA